MSDATRLLMNRCTGLLLARGKLGHVFFTAEDADFVHRNLAKAQLAFGDAVLAAFGQYHWNCLTRHERLRRLAAANFPWPGALRQHHAIGVKFKLHPHLTPLSHAELQVRYENITAFALKVWLWLESCRLGCNFASARDYALNPLDKCPGANPWRNRLLNAKAFGPAAFFSNRSRRYPRERLLNALALLLWDSSALNSEMRIWLNDELGRSGVPETNPVALYQERWRRFS